MTASIEITMSGFDGDGGFAHDLRLTGRGEAVELLADDSPATVPDYAGIVHRSPNYQARKQAEQEVDAHAASAI